jgi:hypothetical protein
MDNGIWDRVGRRFESVVYRYNYDEVSADAVNMIFAPPDPPGNSFSMTRVRMP